jgi:uncharacterized membrane protein
MQPSQLLSFFQCDVLHTIVFSSLLALLILLISPRREITHFIFGLIALGIFYTTPFVWTTDPLAVMPMPLGTLVSKPPVSNFPLFPWSGYFFAGATLTGFFMQQENKQRVARILVGMGFISTFVIFLIKQLPFSYPGWNDWWYASPGHALFRLSGIVLLFSLLFLLEEKFKTSRSGAFLQRCGQESLFIYVSHLMFVYGSVITMGLRNFASAKLKPLETFLIIVAMSGAVYFMAMVWHNIKISHPVYARRTLLAVSILFLVVFVLVPA